MAVALTDLGIPWVREAVVEGGVVVTQIFFKDPDCNMVEVCDCACLPIVPQGRAARRALGGGRALDVAPRRAHQAGGLGRHAAARVVVVGG